MLDYFKDQRLRRAERIRRRKEYFHLYDRGTRITGRFLVGYFARSSRPWSRVGITVSRKVGKPVRRNRVKRRLKEVFRRNKSALSLATDVVLNARRSAADASYADLERDFLDLVACWNNQQRAL